MSRTFDVHLCRTYLFSSLLTGVAFAIYARFAL